MTPFTQVTNLGILVARSAIQSALKWRQQERLTSRKESERKSSLIQARLKDFWPVRSPGLVFLSGWQKLTRGMPIFCAMSSKWWWQKALILRLLFLLLPKNSRSAYLNARLKNNFWYQSGRFFPFLVRLFTFYSTMRSCSFNCCSSMSFSSQSLLSNLLRRMSRLGEGLDSRPGVGRSMGRSSSGMLPEGVRKQCSSSESKEVNIQDKLRLWLFKYNPAISLPLLPALFQPQQYKHQQSLAASSEVCPNCSTFSSSMGLTNILAISATVSHPSSVLRIFSDYARLLWLRYRVISMAIERSWYF